MKQTPVASDDKSMTLVEEQCLLFVRIWADAVQRRVKQVRERRADDERAFRAFERAEDWSPNAVELERRFRELWAEEHSLVWAADQLERWTCRLAKERGQAPPPLDLHLRNVRNALEHLDEAEFEEVPLGGGQGNYQNKFPHAVAGHDERRNRSLRQLKDGRLPIALGAEELLGHIDPNLVEERALALVHQIEDELEQSAADWAAEVERGR